MVKWTFVGRLWIFIRSQTFINIIANIKICFIYCIHCNKYSILNILYISAYCFCVPLLLISHEVHNLVIRYWNRFSWFIKKKKKKCNINVKSNLLGIEKISFITNYKSKKKKKKKTKSKTRFCVADKTVTGLQPNLTTRYTHKEKFILHVETRRPFKNVDNLAGKFSGEKSSGESSVEREIKVGTMGQRYAWNRIEQGKQLAAHSVWIYYFFERVFVKMFAG